MAARSSATTSEARKERARPTIFSARELPPLDVSRLDPQAGKLLSSLRRQVYTRVNRALNGDAVERKRVLARVAGAPRPTDEPGWSLIALTQRLEAIVKRLEAWETEEQRQVGSALLKRYSEMVETELFNLDLLDLAMWLENHDQDEAGERADAVCHCIALNAPTEVQIEKRLAQAGAQKRVFKAKWTVADDPTDIVVKQFLGKSEPILIRERRPHPLSMTHPNIIETFTITNHASPPETFLIERYIEVLDDTKRAPGWSAAARLAVDLARALAFLDDQGLVHGDIKPDNTGYRDGRFILLDFGICRPAGQFLNATQTGSLRTRAPEVLEDETAHSGKADVWSLGATVFNYLFGRFPLFKEGDEVPNAVTQPHERKAFEDELRRRVATAFTQQLEPLADLRHRPLRVLLSRMLERDPKKRPASGDVLQEALRTLPALVGDQEGPRLGAARELRELERHLSDDKREIALLPKRKAKDLEDRVALLERELRAQRHHERTVERLQRTLAQLERDPDAALGPSDLDAIAAFSATADDYELPNDREARELLSRVRAQLALREEEPRATAGDLVKAIQGVLKIRVAASYEDGKLAREAEELQALLPK